MDIAWKTSLWRQFGAAIEMLENAVRACPEQVWGDSTRNARFTDFWYITYHTLFFLDYYLSGTSEGFAPPAPYTLSELDPAGVFPDRVYTKEELLAYLEHGRRKCRAVISAMSDEAAHERCGFTRPDISNMELLLYNMRHVQHHAAQLNLLLRQSIDSAPTWVSKSRFGLETE